MNQNLLTQKEVAKRFKVSGNTIKNWRNQNLLSFFKAPGSSLILYFEDEVNRFIEQHTNIRKGVDTWHIQNERKGKPQMSLNDDWRID